MHLSNTQPLQYPWASFPAPLRDVLLETQSRTKSSIAIVGTSLLSSISLACQNLYDVRVRKDLDATPISLMTVTIAGSGSGKTATDSITLRPVLKFEAREAERHNTYLSTYESELLKWQIDYRALEGLKRKLARSMLKTEVDESIKEENKQCNDKLTAHLNAKPSKPKRFKLLYSNSSIEALLNGLHSNFPSAGMIADEGAIILNSGVASCLHMFNAMWSGTALSVDRVSSESFVLSNVRTTFGVMIQPQAMQQFLLGRGRGARDLGFLARCLPSCPPSNQGARFINPYEAPSSAFHIDKFELRMNELLEMNHAQMKSGVFSRTILEFSPEARCRLTDLHNIIEGLMTPGGWLSDVPDYGSRICENIARIAALFHIFSGAEGDISLDTLDRATAISEWHTNEFIRLFSPVPDLPTEQTDAALLEVWIVDQIRDRSLLCYRSNGASYFKKNDIRQLGPNPIRNKNRLNSALAFMYANNRAQIVKFGKTSYIELNWYYFSNLINQKMCVGANNQNHQNNLLQHNR